MNMYTNRYMFILNFNMFIKTRKTWESIGKCFGK